MHYGRQKHFHWIGSQTIPSASRLFVYYRSTFNLDPPLHTTIDCTVLFSVFSTVQLIVVYRGGYRLNVEPWSGGPQRNVLWCICEILHNILYICVGVNNVRYRTFMSKHNINCLSPLYDTCNILYLPTNCPYEYVPLLLRKVSLTCSHFSVICQKEKKFSFFHFRPLLLLRSRLSIRWRLRIFDSQIW